MRKSEKVGRELQRRRLRGGRLLLRGESQAEVARRVGVTRSTVSDWNGCYARADWRRSSVGRGVGPPVSMSRSGAN